MNFIKTLNKSSNFRNIATLSLFLWLARRDRNLNFRHGRCWSWLDYSLCLLRYFVLSCPRFDPKSHRIFFIQHADKSNKRLLFEVISDNALCKKLSIENPIHLLTICIDINRHNSNRSLFHRLSYHSPSSWFFIDQSICIMETTIREMKTYWFITHLISYRDEIPWHYAKLHAIFYWRDNLEL